MVRFPAKTYIAPLLLLTILCTTVSVTAQQLPPKLSADDWQLTLPQADSTKPALPLAQLKQHLLSLVIFLGPDCPISQKFGDSIRKLHAQYAKDSVAVYGVFPFPLNEREKIAQFGDEYQFAFPLLLDSEFQLTQRLGASITPEFYLINQHGEIVYQGMFNNWYYALGKYRRVITEHYVLDAIEQHFANEPIRIKRTKAIGCFLEMKHHTNHHNH